MTENNPTVEIKAAEAIEAGGIIKLGEDGLLYAGQRKTANTIEAAEAIEAGDMVEIEDDEMPESWGKILAKLQGVSDNDSKPGKKLPSNRTKEYEQPPANPKHSDAVKSIVAQGYKYLGTNGDGYFYFTGANGDGAYTLRPNGALDKVGNKFSRQFLVALEK